MIKVFMANRPPLKEYEDVNDVSALNVGEIYRIASETGNHWRKIFNVYAKFIFSLAAANNDSAVLSYKTWQQYRDERLLQKNSNTQLYFDHDELTALLSDADPYSVRIVMGKTFAESMLKDISLTWLDSYFAINKALGIIVCPYFDYRQLSNERIEILVKHVIALQRNSY
jgi:hypothetical protein